MLLRDGLRALPPYDFLTNSLAEYLRLARKDFTEWLLPVASDAS